MKHILDAETDDFYGSLQIKDTFSLLFSPPKELEFIDKEFDFKLCPDHFIEWLTYEGLDIIGDYKTDVSSMCEYSCLYVSMLLHDVELKGEMKIYYGKFGFWEHYWLGYLIDGEEYFIDLTLQQFNPNAPKVSIVKSHNEVESGRYSSLSEGQPIRDYVKEKEGFDYYTNPITMSPPPIR